MSLGISMKPRPETLKLPKEPVSPASPTPRSLLHQVHHGCQEGCCGTEEAFKSPSQKAVPLTSLWLPRTGACSGPGGLYSYSICGYFSSRLWWNKSSSTEVYDPSLPCPAPGDTVQDMVALPDRGPLLAPPPEADSTVDARTRPNTFLMLSRRVILGNI